MPNHEKSTIFTRFCGRAWCTGHNESDPRANTSRSGYHHDHHDFQLVFTKVEVESGKWKVERMAREGEMSDSLNNSDSNITKYLSWNNELLVAVG